MSLVKWTDNANFCQQWDLESAWRGRKGCKIFLLGTKISKNWLGGRGGGDDILAYLIVCWTLECRVHNYVFLLRFPHQECSHLEASHSFQAQNLWQFWCWTYAARARITSVIVSQREIQKQFWAEVFRHFSLTCQAHFPNWRTGSSELQRSDFLQRPRETPLPRLSLTALISKSFSPRMFLAHFFILNRLWLPCSCSCFKFGKTP